MTRSIADQTVEELGGPGSVLVRQRNDHVELDRLLRELDGSKGRAQEQVLRRIGRLVFSHAFAEETVLWPVLRRTLPDGDALTLRVEKEHQEVNELASELETLGHDDPRRAQRLSRMVEVLREDVRDEEDVLFPRLQEKLDSHELRRLGRQWELARRTSPTRPHPTVSRRPPGNVVSGLPLSLLDRTRDLVDRGVDRAPERLVPAGRAISRGLAAVAGLVERIPASRTGGSGTHQPLTPAPGTGESPTRVPPADAQRPPRSIEASCPRGVKINPDSGPCGGPVRERTSTGCAHA